MQNIVQPRISGHHISLRSIVLKMRLVDLINIYSLDVTIKDLATYIIFPLLSTQSYSIAYDASRQLVLNSIQQPHGYQFYIAFQCFLHVFRETLPKPPRFLKSSNSNHFNRQPPPFFAVIFRCLQHSGAAVVASGWNCPPPLLESITGRPTLRSAPGARKFSPSLWKYHQEACNSQARLDLSIWCGLRLATLVSKMVYWKSPLLPDVLIKPRLFAPLLT